MKDKSIRDLNYWTQELNNPVGMEKQRKSLDPGGLMFSRKVEFDR